MIAGGAFSTRRAFGMIEAVVAVALLGIGVAAALGALGHLIRADTASLERTRMVELAALKLEELRATGDYTLAPLEGDFADWGEPRFQWTAQLDPTGVENLELLTVRVMRVRGPENVSETVDTLVFRPPVAEGGAQP